MSMVYIVLPMKDYEHGEDTKSQLHYLKDLVKRVQPNYYCSDIPLWECNDTRLVYLSKVLTQISDCDSVLFSLNWEDDTECRLIHECVKACGKSILYEEDYR